MKDDGEEKVGVKGRGREMRMVRRWCGMRMARKEEDGDERVGEEGAGGEEGGVGEEGGW